MNNLSAEINLFSRVSTNNILPNVQGVKEAMSCVIVLRQSLLLDIQWSTVIFWVDQSLRLIWSNPVWRGYTGKASLKCIRNTRKLKPRSLRAPLEFFMFRPQWQSVQIHSADACHCSTTYSMSGAINHKVSRASRCVHTSMPAATSRKAQHNVETCFPCVYEFRF